MTREPRVGKPDIRKDIEDEIAYHLEQRRLELRERGVADQVARDEARRRFGRVDEVAAACRRIDEQWYREQRRASMWSDFRQDAAYAVRSLVKSRGFTITAVLTLALGIGANTAIFSVINSVLLRPQPFQQPERLVFLWSTSQALPHEPLTPGRLLDFGEQMTSLSSIAGISHIPLNLTGAGDPERISGSSVSSSFFDVLGTRPLLGDPFHAGRADARDVVISYALWQRRFGGDPSIVGKTIVVNGTSRTVKAVMPREFEWPAITALPGAFDGPEMWVPAGVRDIPRTPSDDPTQDLSANRRSGYLRAVARLRDGVPLAQARQEAGAIAARIAARYPVEDSGRGATVITLRDQLFGPVRAPMLVLLGAVGFVLAIACANIASLLLGRSAARRREIAVRLALGARRSRIVRQLLTESTVLAFVSAVAGLLAAKIALGWLTAASPAGVRGIEHAQLEARVLAFTLVLAVVTGLLCGIVPALQTSASRVVEDLNEGSTRASSGARAGRTRDVLVGLEIAVALVLLIGAGLLLRSFSALSRVDTGIAVERLLTFDLFLSGARAEYQRTQVLFYNDVVREISALPGVVSASAAVTLPIGGDDFAAGVTIEGRPEVKPADQPRAGMQIVMPGYFGTMGIPMRAGRDFTASDTRDAPPVVMVNETFARQHWPGDDPIGRRLKIGRGTGPWLTVVGVVGDIRHMGPKQPPRPEFYQPFTQNSFPFMAFVVRTHGEPTAMTPAIRAAVATLDPAQPISGVNTMEAHLERALSQPKFMSTLVAVFGSLALVLAVVGIYGVMAYSVAQRAREIAIRAALGARRADVMRLILGKALWLAGTGIVAGIAVSVALSKFLTGLLYGVAPTDAPTYVGVAIVLAFVALVAAAIPALRATRIDGAQVLRT
jgi:predicted permease